MTTIALKAKRIEQKTRVLALPSIPWKLFYILGIILVVSMMVGYVMLVNQLTKGSYLVKNYNSQLEAINQQGKVLETNFAESGFLGSVQERVQQLGFEKTTQVQYIQVSNGALGMVK